MFAYQVEKKTGHIYVEPGKVLFTIGYDAPLNTYSLLFNNFDAIPLLTIPTAHFFSLEFSQIADGKSKHWHTFWQNSNGNIVSKNVREATYNSNSVYTTDSDIAYGECSLK